MKLQYNLMMGPLGMAPSVLVDAERIANSAENTGGICDVMLVHPTGSAYTCNPPVTDTDKDWLVWAEDYRYLEDLLIREGFEQSENQEQYPYCMSYRKGDVNIIVVYGLGMYMLWVKATEVCKMLNVQSKEHRKLVHQILCEEEL